MPLRGTRPAKAGDARNLIQPAKGPSDGWLAKEAWDWLHKIVVPQRLVPAITKLITREETLALRKAAQHGLAAVRFVRQEIGWFKTNLALMAAEALNP